MLIINGHEFGHPDSPLTGDGRFPPFYIFDSNKQANIAGPFHSQLEAENAFMPAVLNHCADRIEAFRLDLVFDGPDLPDGLASVKYLQAVALLEQARHVMKEAALNV